MEYILADDYWAATIIPKISHPAYQVGLNVTVFQTTELGAYFYDWMYLLFYQLKISRSTNDIPGYFQYFQLELKIPGNLKYTSWRCRHPRPTASPHDKSVIDSFCKSLQITTYSDSI